MAEIDSSWLVAAAGVFGLVIGSFLNVVILRLPKAVSVIRPGSHCPGCERPIRWFENIPVLSFVLLRGRCRGCRKPISLRYPVVELLTALLFVATLRKFGAGPALLVHDWPFISILIAISFIDLDHRIIPDRLSLGGTLLGLATSWMIPGLGFLESLFGAVIGFGVFYLFAWLYWRMAGRSGLGGGDIKLMALLGAFLGPASIFPIVLISSVVGSVAGIVVGLLAGRQEGEQKLLRTSIPFGPFLVLAALYYYLLGDLIWLPSMTPT